MSTRRYYRMTMANRLRARERAGAAEALGPIERYTYKHPVGHLRAVLYIHRGCVPELKRRML